MGRNTKWMEYYDSEEELIEDMLITYTNDRGDLDKLCKHYKYINCFKEYWFKHGELTSDQIIYVKRFAEDIYINVHYTKEGIKKPSYGPLKRKD